MQVYYGSDLILRLDLFSGFGLNVDLTIVFDFARLAFGSLVLIISFRVCLYSLSYMFYDSRNSGFFILVFMFVMSMMILITVGSFVCLLLG